MKKLTQIATLGLSTLLLSACNHHHDHLDGMDHVQHLYDAGAYHHAFKEVEVLAEGGDSEAEYVVGYMYYYGMGIAKDMDMARKWIRQSAEHKFAPAQHALEILVNDPDQYTTFEAQTHEEAHDRGIPSTVRYAQNAMPHNQLESDVNWMREQNPGDYTIVLNTDKLEQVAKKSELHNFKYLKNGDPAKGTTYGTYKDAEKAKEAYAQLPKMVRASAQIEPWAAVQTIMLPS